MGSSACPSPSCHSLGNTVEGAQAQPPSLPLEAPSLPLATESRRTTETRPENAEWSLWASKTQRSREASCADCHVDCPREGGTSGGAVFFFRLLAPAGPSRTGPCGGPPPPPPRPPAAGPAATMKKFFQEIKADIKFKSAGPGQKLTESVGCVTGVEA